MLDLDNTLFTCIVLSTQIITLPRSYTRTKVKFLLLNASAPWPPFRAFASCIL